MLCVISGHVSGTLEGTYRLPTLNTFTLTLMPAFVMLSGYCNLHSMEKIDGFNELKKMIGKLLLKLKVPATVMTLVWFPFSLKIRDLVPIISRYWFLDMLLILLLSFALFVCLVKNAPPRQSLSNKTWSACSILSKIYYNVKGKYGIDNIIFICVLFVTIMIWVPVYGISDLCIFFIAGILLKKYDVINRYSTISKSAVILLITVFANILYYNLPEDLTSYEDSFYVSSLISLLLDGRAYVFFARVALGLLNCLSLICIIKHLSKQYTVISYCGSKTLFIYEFHMFVLFALGCYPHFFHIDYLVYLCRNNYCLSLLVGVFITMALFVSSVVIGSYLANNRVTKLLFGV